MEHPWQRAFTEHPRSVGESYAQHFLAASRFAMRILAAGFACLLHAIVPGCCETTASRAIAKLAAEMEARRRTAPSYALTAAIADSSSSAASLHSRSRS